MTSKLFPVYLLHFVNFFNLMLWGPVLEPILNQQKITDPKLILILNGLIIATYPLFQFLAIQPLNSLSQTYGKKKILLVTQAGTVVSIALGILAISLPILREVNFLGISLGIYLLILSRITDGISGGNAMINNGYATDIINSEKLDSAETFSMVELSMIAGSLSGVFLGPLFSRTRFGMVGALYLILFVSLVGIYIIFAKVNNIKAKQVTKSSLKEDLNLVHQLNLFKNNKMVQKTLFYRFIFQIIFISFIANIFLFLRSHLGIEGSETSIVMLLVAIITIIAITLINPIINNRYGNVSGLKISKVLLVIGLLMFFLFPFLGNDLSVGALLLFSYLILVTGVTISLSLFKYFLTISVEEELQGKVLALEEQILIIAGFIGPVVTGAISAIFVEYGLPAQFMFFYFILLAVVYFVTDYLIFKIKK